jgi:hypothetical protein
METFCLYALVFLSSSANCLLQHNYSLKLQNHACLLAHIEQVPTTVKSDGTRARHTHHMSCLVLPCGCTMQWDNEETTIVFCSRHTIDYMRWEGSDRDFVKRVATPPRIDRKKPMAGLQ